MSDAMRTIRSQFWSFDVIFAVVIFSMAISLIAIEWFSLNTQLSLGYTNNANLMQIQVQTISKSVLRQGSPTNWESLVNTSNSLTWNNVSIGMGAGDGVKISTAKLAAFVSMANSNYQATKQPLGISYEYFIQIYNSNLNLSIGSNPSLHNAVTVDTATASGYINSDQVTIKILVWTNTTFGVA